MMDLASESRLALVIPELAEKIHATYELLLAENILIRVAQGLRTWADQAALYAKGRTLPGPEVTKSPPGYSMHQFGLAVDCMPSLNPPSGPYAIDGVAGSPRYVAMRAIAEAQGLISGSRWTSIVDWPHLQMPNVPASPTDQMRADLQKEGLQWVWANYRQGLYAGG